MRRLAIDEVDPFERDAQAGGAPDRPVVERHVARERFQQARLAGAVAADERDALAGVDAEIRAFEKGHVAEGKRPLLEM